MAEPKVSICIPTHNAEPFMERTLRSVLAQTFEDYEIVLSDDGSEDATLAVARGFDDPRLRIVHSEPGRGAGANWNHALGEARGQYVKLLCQDDVIYPSCLEQQVGAFDDPAHASVVLVACQRDLVDD